MFVVPIAIQNGFTHFDFEAFSEDTIKVGIAFINTPDSKKAANFDRQDVLRWTDYTICIPLNTEKGMISRRPVIKSQIFETPGIVITNTRMFAMASK